MKLKIFFILCVIILVFTYVTLVIQLKNECIRDGGNWVTIREAGINNEKNVCVK